MGNRFMNMSNCSRDCCYACLTWKLFVYLIVSRIITSNGVMMTYYSDGHAAVAVSSRWGSGAARAHSAVHSSAAESARVVRRRNTGHVYADDQQVNVGTRHRRRVRRLYYRGNDVMTHWTLGVARIT